MYAATAAQPPWPDPLTIEVGDGRRDLVDFPPTGDRLRGWHKAVPGCRVVLDCERRTARVFDPLEDTGRVVKGLSASCLKRWLLCMAQLVACGQARVVDGTLPPVGRIKAIDVLPRRVPVGARDVSQERRLCYG